MCLCYPHQSRYTYVFPIAPGYVPKHQNTHYKSSKNVKNINFGSWDCKKLLAYDTKGCYYLNKYQLMKYYIFNYSKNNVFCLFFFPSIVHFLFYFENAWTVELRYLNVCMSIYTDKTFSCNYFS